MTADREAELRALADAATRERLELIDILAVGDGQSWPDFWQNPEQRRIGETMYGAMADEILSSSWYARLVDVRAERDRLQLRVDRQRDVLDHAMMRCVGRCFAPDTALAAALDAVQPETP